MILRKALCIKNKFSFRTKYNFYTQSLLVSKIFSFTFKTTFTTMEETDVLCPPENVNGMKELDRSAFTKIVDVPCIKLKKEQMTLIVKSLKRLFLKMRGIKPVQEIGNSEHIILFNPCLIKTFDDFKEDILIKFKNLKVDETNFSKKTLKLSYENYSADAIIKALVPKNEAPLTSYSLVGHIIHLNIKEHLLDYKNIIANVLLDKHSYAKTVVYKKKIIDNIYRNFEMEVLCGEPKFLVSTIEYGTKFEFDFSKVYWNPRLSTEHDRIVQMLSSNDALFDVFSGVGPFAIRAAKKKCLVLANDLNPESFKWLNHNINLNTKAKNNIITFNKDGADFIQNDVKTHLLKIWNDENFIGKIHVVMNLPSTALTFLKCFKGIIKESDLKNIKLSKMKEQLPIIHCHFFVKEPDTNIDVFERDSGMHYNEQDHKFFFVRSVSLGKSMFRVTFTMPFEFLLAENSDFGEPLCKRFCINN